MNVPRRGIEPSSVLGGWVMHALAILGIRHLLAVSRVLVVGMEVVVVMVVALVVEEVVIVGWLWRLFEL